MRKKSGHFISLNPENISSKFKRPSKMKLVSNSEFTQEKIFNLPGGSQAVNLENSDLGISLSDKIKLTNRSKRLGRPLNYS